MPAEAARAAAETAARASYGRLLAFLAARSRDVAGAEDALSDAFRTALERWPEHGVPDRPEAWLLVAARRNLIHSARHGRVRAAAAETLRLAADEAAAGAGDDPTIFPDERLKLLFICAHPAIAESVRAPLMLQTVLGLDAARIASAFLVAPAAMGQRLVRAKAKIRDAGIAFEVPGPEMLAGRLHAVLEAIYAAYGSGWDDPTGLDPRRHDLAGEAIWLAQLIVELLPAEPEAKGLLALMLHCEARRPARRGPDGAFVPLTEQETGLWSRPMIEAAERALAGAAALHRLGPFQLEAAIQSAHAQRAVTGRTDWAAIADLYEGLAAIDPSAGVLVGRAVAIAEKGGPAAGLAALDDVPSVAAYQPYWAVRADLLRRLGRGAEARAAYTRAIGLSEDPAVRDFLGRRSAALG